MNPLRLILVGLLLCAAAQAQFHTAPPSIRTNLSTTTGLGGGSGSLGLLTNGVYYVSAAAGSDTYGTGSVTAPWLTPTNAIARVSAGLIHVAGGQYQFAVGGKHNVHWFLESDCVLGSTNVVEGPIFEATNGVSFTVYGPGTICASNIAIRTSGSGEITLDGAKLIPAAVLTNNLAGQWREP
jgi:hypothetical protein